MQWDEPASSLRWLLSEMQGSVLGSCLRGWFLHLWWTLGIKSPGAALQMLPSVYCWHWAEVSWLLPAAGDWYFVLTYIVWLKAVLYPGQNFDLSPYQSPSFQGPVETHRPSSSCLTYSLSYSEEVEEIGIWTCLPQKCLEPHLPKSKSPSWSLVGWWA